MLKYLLSTLGGVADKHHVTPGCQRGIGSIRITASLCCTLHREIITEDHAIKT
jgi:hypothetical protein